MEFLLQWLDELDDLAATALFVWHRAGPAWLVPGLAASILLHFDRIGSESFPDVLLSWSGDSESLGGGGLTTPPAQPQIVPKVKNNTAM